MIKVEPLYKIPFGKGSLEFRLLPGMQGFVAAGRPVEPLKDPLTSARAALSRPVGSPRLRDMAGPGHRVCIVFTDMTRAAPDHLMVPALLEELEMAGVKDHHITLLCGTGMHRPSTDEEKIIKLGKKAASRYRIVDHDACNPALLADLGTSSAGAAPISVNRLAYESDILIATGIVEPHQYAGYSGGGKTVAVGAGGEPFIAYTHGPAMIDRPGTRLGMIAGNPFRAEVDEAARRAGLRFILNAILDQEKRPVAFMAGNPEAAFERLVAAARTIYEVPVPRQYRVVVAGVGYPKDVNLYQACRAASYLFFAPAPVVGNGGVIILPAETPEGAGHGTGEKRFLETMKGAARMGQLLDELRLKGYPPGAQRAFIMAKVLEKIHVIVVGSKTPDVVRQVHMIPVPDMETALHEAIGLSGLENPDVLIVPHAMLTLPIVTGSG